MTPGRMPVAIPSSSCCPAVTIFLGFVEHGVVEHERFCLRDEFVVHEILCCAAFDQHGDRFHRLKVIAVNHS